MYQSHGFAPLRLFPEFFQPLEVTREGVPKWSSKLDEHVFECNPVLGNGQVSATCMTCQRWGNPPCVGKDDGALRTEQHQTNTVESDGLVFGGKCQTADPYRKVLYLGERRVVLLANCGQDQEYLYQCSRLIPANWTNSYVVSRLVFILRCLSFSFGLF